MDIPKFETPDFEFYRIGMPREILGSILEIPASMHSMQRMAMSAVVAGVGLDNELSTRLTQLKWLFEGKERDAGGIVNNLLKRKHQEPEDRLNSRQLITTGAATLVLLKGIGSLAANRSVPAEAFDLSEGAVECDIPDDKQEACTKILNEVTRQLSIRWDMTDETGLGNYVTVTTGTKDEPNRRWLTAQVMNGNNPNKCRLRLSGIRPVSEQHGVSMFPKSARKMGKLFLVIAGREIVNAN